MSSWAPSPSTPARTSPYASRPRPGRLRSASRWRPAHRAGELDHEPHGCGSDAVVRPRQVAQRGRDPGRSLPRPRPEPAAPDPSGARGAGARHRRATSTREYHVQARRISGGSGRRTRSAHGRSGVCRATAATAPSGHHATPRMAYIPMRKKRGQPQERGPGGHPAATRDERRPPRAPRRRTASRAPTEASRLPLVMRWVTSEFVERPTA